MFDNDATACYDHIIPSMAMIKCHHAGLNCNTANVVLQFLQKTHYHVQTAYGISIETFSNFIDYILGLMQGTGVTGPGWAVTSSVMLDQMETTHQAHFHSPQEDQKSTRTREAFVNDSSLWLLKMGLSLCTIIQLMQFAAQKWEQLLYATGGALNHPKCFWYGITWHFSVNGKCTMQDLLDPEDPTIQLTAGNDTTQKYMIQHMKTSTGTCTLGVWLAPDGNDKDEYQYRLKQAHTMKQHLCHALIGRSHAYIGFQSIWKAMILYPLGTMCFTAKQCQQLQAVYLPSFLSKMGISQTTATTICNSPISLGGLNIFHHKTEQGVMQMKLLISHLRKNDDVGHLLKISKDHLQLQAGVPWPVMSQPGHQQHKYIDKCYLSHLWEFLDSTQTHL